MQQTILPQIPDIAPMRWMNTEKGQTLMIENAMAPIVRTKIRTCILATVPARTTPKAISLSQPTRDRGNLTTMTAPHPGKGKATMIVTPTTIQTDPLVLMSQWSMDQALVGQGIIDQAV